MSGERSKMKVQPAAFLRTTLPLNLANLDHLDSGRYHSIWLPDHMVSFWPDSIWTPEFTDLATVSPSPHRYLDSMAVAGAVSVLTQTAAVATTVVDTVRRHPASLAQTALSLSHLSKGRFILGLGSGEAENIVPYGFEFSKSVSRFEEAVKVIRLLWESNGLIDFNGQFFDLHHARLDTEPYEGRFPQMWFGASGPRMLALTGRLADGWWPPQSWSPEFYAGKLAVVRDAAEKAGRDPDAIVTASTMSFLMGDDDELAEIVQAPLIKAWILQVPADVVRSRGYEHPMGDGWNGYHDIDPGLLTRDRVLEVLAKVTPEMILSLFRHGTPKQAAAILKHYCDAGLQVPGVIDYSGMAGTAFGARSSAKVKETEDELLRLCGQSA